MRPLLSILFIAILMLVPLDTQAEEILSKEDAKNTFSLSFAQWSSNVRQLQAAGLARFAFTEPNEFTLLILTPVGVLKVTPSYLSNELEEITGLVAGAGTMGFETTAGEEADNSAG